MAKESLANKMARKAFYRNDVQQSWKAHMQAFGPILRPAFADNFQAKIHLTAALNHISKGNLQQAMPKLQTVQNFIENDADKAMLLFALGVYCETAGAQAEMAAYYSAANQCGHSFYLPYLKVAKYCLAAADYAPAEENFRKAIACFDAAALSEADKIILGSAYANLGSCLTMLHRYEDAWTALENSKAFCPDAPGRAAAEAVSRGECDRGIVICTTGIGISITANKVKGIRCALCGDTLTAELTRRHNNSNMLALAGGFVAPFAAEHIVDVFLNTEFEGGRHERRVNLMMETEG